MKRIWVGILAAAVVSVGATLPANASPEPPAEPTTEVIQGFVVTRSDQASTAVTEEQAQAVADQTERAVVETVSHEAEDVVRLDAPLDGAAATEFMVELAAQPGVELVEPIGRFTADYTPYDPNFNQQWYFSNAATGLGSLPIWDHTRGAGVTVAVLDSGKTTHDEINWTGGYDFVSDAALAADGNGVDPDPTDAGWPTPPPQDCGLWHGTMVGGLIGAQHNRTGIAGLVPESTLVPVRVLGTCGGDSYDIARAIRWSAGLSEPGIPANPNPARVLNLSFGGAMRNAAGQFYCPTYLQNAINEARAAGAVLVASTGNGGLSQLINAPAICTGVIAVTSTDQAGRIATNADHGPGTTLAAPGDYIYTTTNTGQARAGTQSYTVTGGTSFSTALVSGTIALMLATNPGLNVDQISAQLVQQARPVAGAGAGILSAQAAVPVPATDAIVNRWRALGGAGSALGLPRQAPFGVGAGRGQRYDAGHIYQSAGGVHPVLGAIHTGYQASGGPAGVLGFPTAAEQSVAGGAMQTFERGRVYWSPNTGAQPIRGGMLGTHNSLGGVTGMLGFPTSAEYNAPGGAIQTFTGGIIAWTPAAGTYPVYGAIGWQYLNQGGPSGALGWPRSNEIAVPGGVYQLFENGRIYWSRETGAQPLRDGMLGTHNSLGGVTGMLGFPTSAEYNAPGGAVQTFTGGVIMWTPAAGTYPVYGSIGWQYLAMGGSSGALGWPRSYEIPMAGGVVQIFERGRMYWSPTTGPQPVFGAIGTTYLAHGEAAGRLGFPIGPEQSIVGGTQQRFQHGIITWRTGSIQVSFS